MKKVLPLICLFLCTFYCGDLYGQLPPCCTAPGVPAGCQEPAGTSVGNSCIICSPAGIFSGNNGGYPASGTFSCGVPHNSAWVSVIADASGNIDAIVLTSNCVTGDGLQLILWDNAGNEIECFSVGGSPTATVSQSGLVPGALYHFQIDGFSGDVCDYTIIVTGNEAGQIPDPITGFMADPDTTLCPGAEVCFTIDDNPTANQYEWIPPANMRVISGGGPNDLFMCCIVETVGGGVVRVTPSNFCFNGFPALLPTVATPIPPVIWPPIWVCNSDMPWDTTVKGKRYIFDQYGGAKITIVTALGCDSIINLSLIPKVQIPGIVDTTICEGDCVMVGPDCYSDIGNTVIVLTDPRYRQKNGCDSTVNLILQKLNPLAVVSDPDDLPCMPGSTVALDGSGSSTGAAVTYNWTAQNGGTFASATNMNVAAASSPGTYILAVTESNLDGSVTCVALDTVEVEQLIQPLNDPVFSEATTNTCLGETYEYTIGPITGAINYNWTIPIGATMTGGGTSIMVTFASGVGGPICVQAIGACGESMNVCIPVTINPIPTSSFTASTPICISNTSTITYTGTASPFATFTWNFNGGMPAAVTGAGPHNINWTSPGAKTITLTVEENGCTSTQTTQVVQVDAELATPVLTCDPTQTSVTFSWAAVPGANDYTITINGGAPMTQTGTTFPVSPLNPGDIVTIVLVANSTSACPSTTVTDMCEAQNCPAVTIDIPQVADICRDAATTGMNLTATQMGGLGGGAFTWSGPGVSANGAFNPSAANVGVNTISVQYMEGTCTYTGSTDITVNDVPDPSFTVVSPICESETSTITYTGSASAAANYDWDLGTGSIVSGTGAGPLEVSWSGGNQSVSLTVSENGCTSPVNTQPVIVDAELAIPVINCGTATTTSVEFTWDEVPGAVGYTINGPPGAIVDQTSRTITVNGLGQGDEITVEVVAESGGACPSTRATAMCPTSDCPVVTVTPTAIGPFCDDGTGTAVALQATSSAPGTFEWTGPGVTNNMFDPNSPVINPGDITLTAILTIDNCEYRENLVVTIFGKPTSTFTAPGPICEGDEVAITYDGNADVTTATFDWDFAGGTPGTASTVGPHNVAWVDGGDKTVSLTVTDNNCVSDPTMVIVQVDEPLEPVVIDCTSDQESIHFTWPFVANALDYQVNIISGAPSGDLTSPGNFEIGGLSPGNEVVIEVTATGNTVCGPITFTGSCIAQDCPEYNVTLPVFDPICVYDGLGNFVIGDDAGFTIIDRNTMDDITGDVTMSWSTGDPATSYVNNSGLFYPVQAMDQFGEGDATYEVQIEYPIGSRCYQTFSGTIPLRRIHNFAFFMDQQVCETDPIGVAIDVANYSELDATYTWDFGRAIADPGGVNEFGPHQLMWNDGGFTDLISLGVVTIDGCDLGLVDVPVRVDSVLNPNLANLQCNPANTGNQMIEFTWDDGIPGVTNYDINVLTPGFNITSQTGSSAFFGGLTPGDEIKVELTMTDANSLCPPVTSCFTCLAKQCDPVDITFEPILDNCLNPTGSTTIQLREILTPDPSGGAGTRIFSGGPHISPTGEFTVDAQGTYPIAFDFSFDGCNYSGSTTITMIETPIADFTMDDLICEEDGAVINFTGSAHPDAVLTWDFNGGTPASMDDRDPESVSWNAAGMNTVSLSIDNGGCADGPVTRDVVIDPAIDPIVGSCDAASTTGVSVSWNSDPNVDEYEIRVSYPAGIGAPQLMSTQTNTDYEFPNVPAGSMQRMVDIIITPITSSSCPAPSVTITCEALPCPTIRLIYETLGAFCVDDDTAYPIVASLLGGDGSGTLDISGPGVSNDEFTPANAGEGTHTITFTHSEQGGCDYTFTEEIIVNPLPRVEAGNDMILSCNDLTVDLMGNDLAGATYSWTLGGVSVGSQQGITVADGGTYTLEMTDANGCVNTDEVIVDASFTEPDLELDFNDISCFGRGDGSITVEGMAGGVPPLEYSFNGGPFSATNTFFSNLGQGTYTIVGRDANGCTDTETINVAEPNELFVEILISGGENPVPFGDSIELSADVSVSPDDLSAITWSPADQFPICDDTNIDNCITFWVTPAGQTVYSVRVETGPGCAADDNINIVGIKDHPIFIPSGFSPGDANGTNDFFGVFGDPEIIREVKSFLIFNRWGEVVFENYNFQVATQDEINPADGWDGTFRGKPMNSGVFVYVVEVEFFDGLIELFKGDVTIK